MHKALTIEHRVRRKCCMKLHYLCTEQKHTHTLGSCGGFYYVLCKYVVPTYACVCVRALWTVWSIVQMGNRNENKANVSFHFYVYVWGWGR